MQLDLIAFDVNGTLLDMSVMDPLFANVYGSAAARQAWFEQLQALWLKANATGQYQPFESLARQAMEMLASYAGKKISKDDEEAILAQMTALPPFPDVVTGLERLRKLGRPIAVLTNGAEATVRAQLKHANLTHLIDAVFSAEEVERYKPAPEPYLRMLRTLGVTPDRAMMVAAHGWDTTGAKNAGLHAAFIRRPGNKLDTSGPRPEHDAIDLATLAAGLEKLGVG